MNILFNFWLWRFIRISTMLLTMSTSYRNVLILWHILKYKNTTYIHFEFLIYLNKKKLYSYVQPSILMILSKDLFCGSEGLCNNHILRMILWCMILHLTSIFRYRLLEDLLRPFFMYLSIYIVVAVLCQT